MYYVGGIMCDPNYLEHHGIKGQRWGVRRFQNEDGTLTAAGKARYLTSDGEFTKAARKEWAKSNQLLIKQEHALTKSGKKKIMEKRKNHVWESIASERFKIKAEQLRKRQEEEVSKLSDDDKKRIARDLKKALKDYTSAKDNQSKIKALQALGEMDGAVTYKFGAKFIKELVGDNAIRQLAEAADEYAKFADYYW